MKAISKAKHFFILGAAKCGTTSLYYYLSQHSDICMSFPKEPLFFEKEYNKGIDYYLNKNFLQYRGEKFLGSARHRNLYLPYVPKRIFNCFPDAKLLVTVRNPVDRAYSHFLHRKRRNYEKLTFEEAIKEDLNRIDRGESIETENEIENYIKSLNEIGVSSYYRTYLDSGYYAKQIVRYYKYFDKRQIKIIFLDDLKKDPKIEIKKILLFLDEKFNSTPKIDYTTRNKRKSKIYNSLTGFKSIIPLNNHLMKLPFSRKLKDPLNSYLKFLEIRFFKSEGIKPATRAFLIEHYKKHNERLEKICGRSLTYWNK